MAFTGQPGDIWYIFILAALCGYVGAVNNWLELVSIPLSVLLYLIIGRWFFAKLTCDGGSALTFTGGYWQFLGWTLLFAISFLTVIGWAWVMTGTMRWACRSVEGSRPAIEFRRQRLGRAVAQPAVRSVLHRHHPDPVDAALVYSVDGFAILPERARRRK